MHSQIANAGDDVLLFYNENQFTKLLDLMKTERGTDVPTSNLLYHLNLLKLLTICTEGKNVNTEMRCHSLLPLDEIVKITTHPECIPEVGGVGHTHNRQWAPYMYMKTSVHVHLSNFY